VAIDFRTIAGASGVVSDSGFKACLPVAAPSPLLSLRALDRIETSAASATFSSPDLRSIEGTQGHTLRRHVGLSDAALQARALRTHHDVSTFEDAVTAQLAVDEAFVENQRRIGAWVAAQRGANLALHVHFDTSIGRVFSYASGAFEPAQNADVILEHRPKMPNGYTVITAYPTVS
jgi:hypothetical protein